MLRITAVKLGVTLLVNEIWKTRERVPPAGTPLKVQILVINNTIAAFNHSWSVKQSYMKISGLPENLNMLLLFVGALNIFEESSS